MINDGFWPIALGATLRVLSDGSGALPLVDPLYVDCSSDYLTEANLFCLRFGKAFYGIRPTSTFPDGDRLKESLLS